MQNSAQSSSHLNDNVLVHQVQQHDKGAFSILYDRYSRLIYAMAVHMLGHHRAEEAVQEVFMTLWHKADRFDAARGSFKSWFSMVARNYLRDELRQHYLSNHHADLPDWQQLLEQIADPAADIREMTSEREQKHTINEALNGLPAEQRQAIVMAYFGGYTQSAIAQALDWPLGTVKKRIRLGLQKLRRVILLQEDILDHQPAASPQE